MIGGPKGVTARVSDTGRPFSPRVKNLDFLWKDDGIRSPPP